MPLFLFMSGYFAFGLLQRKTLSEFVQHRYRRILLPLLFACVSILPLDFYAWGIGFVLDGRASWRKLRSLKFDESITQDLWGLSHLWYLQYLLLYSLLLAVGWVAWKRVTRNSTDNARSLLTRMGMALLPTATMAVLLIEPEVVIGFQHSAFPVPAKFAYSGLFFCGGVLLCCSPHLIEKLKRISPALLAVSIPLTVLMVRLTHDYFRVGFDSDSEKLYAVTTASFAWLTVVGLSGLCLRIQRPLPQSIQFVGVASFWVYLFHHPVVGLVQALLGQTSLPAIAKFCLATISTMVICLASYRYLVDGTWVGRLLNGQALSKRQPRESASQSASETVQSHSSRRAS